MTTLLIDYIKPLIMCCQCYTNHVPVCISESDSILLKINILTNTLNNLEHQWRKAYTVVHHNIVIYIIYIVQLYYYMYTIFHINRKIYRDNLASFEPPLLRSLVNEL